MQIVSVYFSKPCPIPPYHSSQFFLFFGKKIHNVLWQIKHNERKNTYHSFRNRSDSCFYGENSMNHILDFDNIFLLPPGSFGGPDANL